jgi:hypothetical protein
MGRGEFWCARSDDGAIGVQARLGGNDGNLDVSWMTAIAAKVGAHRVGIYSETNKIVIKVDGEPILIPFGRAIPIGDREGFLGRDENGLYISWPGYRPLLAINQDGDFLSAEFKVWNYQDSAEYSGLWGRIQGTTWNDLWTTSGIELQTPVTFQMLYGEFRNGWRVTSADSLFDYKADESTDGFFNSNTPTKIVTTETLTEEQKTNATQICTEAGVTDATILSTCILDVALTNNSAFASAAFRVKTPSRVITVQQ